MNFDWSRIIRLLGAGLASICTFLFGKPDVWLLTLLAFVVIDYCSGVIAAYINHELNSRVGFIGILKKTMYFFVVAVAHCVDVATAKKYVGRKEADGSHKKFIDRHNTFQPLDA